MLALCCLGALLTGFQGCESDLSPRSLVSNLTITGVQVSPPEARPVFPDNDQRITAMVTHPTALHETLEYAFIACTSYTGVDGCLEEAALATEEDLENGYLEIDESEYRTFFESFIRRGQVEIDGLWAEFSAELLVPANYGILLSEFGYSAIQGNISVLVCRQGLCPVLEEIDRYLAGDVDAMTGPELMTVISTPGLIVSGAPIEGVALGRKAYLVSLNDRSNLNHNPSIQSLTLEGCEEALAATEPEERVCQVSVALTSDSIETYFPSSGTSVTAQEAVVMRFYSTAGTMLPFSLQAYPSNFSYLDATLQLPPIDETPAEVGVFVIAEDSRTGMDYAATRFGTSD